MEYIDHRGITINHNVIKQEYYVKIVSSNWKAESKLDFTSGKLRDVILAIDNYLDA